MTSATAPRGEPAGLRERLIAVDQRFRKFGFRHAGIADIARDAGIATGTVYRYFKDKEDLFRAVLAAEHELWIGLAREILAKSGSASERLAELARASVTFHEKYVLLASVLANDTDMIKPPLLQALQQNLLESMVGPLAEVLAEGMHAGEFRPLDPARTARVLFLCGQALFRQGSDDYPELLAILGELTQQGLRRPVR
jgi:AcrR family transcriptional regulator